MSSLLSKIQEDLKSAQLDKQETVVSTLRFLISSVNNAKIAKGEDLSDDEVLSEIKKDAKKHKESIEAYKNGGRAELAKKEETELAILSKYLPEQMARAEIEKLVEEAITETKASSMGDMGRVMSSVMSKTKGDADGGEVSAIVKEKLK